MKEININNVKRSDLIFEISKVVDSDDDATLIVDYLEKSQENRRIISQNEFFDRRDIFTTPPNVTVIGFVTSNYRYSVNINYATIAVIALILDIEITQGLVSMLAASTGLSIQSIKKIPRDHRCFVAEVYLKKHCSYDDLNYEHKECVWNNLDCSYRDYNGICTRSSEVVNTQAKKLLDDKVIKQEDGKLKISF